MRRAILMTMFLAGLTACGHMDHCFYTDDNQTCSLIGRRFP